MKKVLFIDRDGTIITEPPDEQIDSLEKLQFVPGAISNLRKIAEELDYLLVMVTNQDGLGTDAFPESTFWPAHEKMLDILRGERIDFDEILIDRSLPAENAPTRKPGTALLTHYLTGNFDLKESYVIGDRASDIDLARNLGCNAIRIGAEDHSSAALTTTSWSEIYRFLAAKPRVARVERMTKETQISIALNLDGRGHTDIDTGLGFFDHMLEQIGRHGLLDLTAKVEGDLHIDEHHTIEDTALVLGRAFDQALGSRKNIGRYGFTLPMDDALAQVAIDFGGRPWINWKATFIREKIGEMPTEMFYHFFKSFSDTARCNLDIRVEGENEHHKIESVFKAFARALRQAVAKDLKTGMPSTKGLL